MENQDLTTTIHHLPATAPDLTLSVSAEGHWRVVRCAPEFGRWLGKKSPTMTDLEDAITPRLRELGQEVLSDDTPLHAIPLRLAGARNLVLTADIEPGGLTPDYRGKLLYVFLQPSSAAAEAKGGGYAGMVGAGPAIREVFRKIELYAPSDAAVIVTGETGSGKELVARALHDAGPRAAQPFVAVNCAAISAELLESELFGHEKGAFTGAVREHRGRFERADGGTLFLDEIGDMPPHTQAKLLRALETGTIERVGGERERRVDVRIVAATNVPLEQAVGSRRFRADLYHRLSVLRIHLPPLRERTEDIPVLVEHFLAEFSAKYDRRIERLTPEALQLLQSYLWPGNIRELRNVLERVFVETQAEVIGAKAFREWVGERQSFTPGDWNLAELERRDQPPLITPVTRDYLDAEYVRTAPERSTRPADLDAETIRLAYRAADGNLTAAARRLGVHRATLYRYMEKLGLVREDLE